MQLRILCALSLSVAALASSAPSAAQSSTAAEALYRDAQALLSAGKAHEACLKFQESQRLDPGIGTLINLASCHEKEGKTASAWSEFTEAAAQASRSGQHDREQFAQEHAAALDKKLDRLVLEVLKPSPGMVVKLDGEVFGQGALGTAIPLDPGDHEIQVTAPGKKPWSQHLRMGPGAVTNRVEVPALENDNSAPPPSSGFVPGPQSDSPPTSKPNTPRQNAGLVVGGVGAAGLVIAGVLGVRTVLFNNKSADEASKGAAATNPIDQSTMSTASKNDLNAASTNQTGAIIAGAAGAVALGTGIYLFITPSKAPNKTGSVLLLPQVAKDGGGANFKLSW